MNLRLILCASFLLLVTGCFNLRQPAPNIDYYQIDYKAMNMPTPKTLDTVLGVQNFTVATAYDNNRLVYKIGPFERDTYFYKRWITNPGAMITSALTKDLQNSGSYRAVTGVPGRLKWDYEIQGYLRDIYEDDMGDNWKCVIDLEITLIRGTAGSSKRWVLFQKNYHSSIPCNGKGLRAVVAAMSEAMQVISIELQGDVYNAVKDDLKGTKGIAEKAKNTGNASRPLVKTPFTTDINRRK
ncbi:MAG: ABC-type transport auxiliary lipoprotein family protein [Candidatus Brocadiales bacterium]